LKNHKKRSSHRRNYGGGGDGKEDLALSDKINTVIQDLRNKLANVECKTTTQEQKEEKEQPIQIDSKQGGYFGGHLKRLMQQKKY
jgi:hypothetical protein